MLLGAKKKIPYGGRSGEVPQYFVENSHPAIVPQDTFDLVQSEIIRRAALGKQRISGSNPFTGKVFCGNCGALYGTKQWRDRKGGKKIVWQCKGRGRGACSAPYLSEELFRQAFIRAYNELLGDKDRYMQELEAACAELTDMQALDADIAGAGQELEVLAGLMQRAIEENAHAPLDQNDYQQRYTALRQRFEAEKARQDELTAQRQERTAKRAKIRRFLDELRKRENLITDFDEHAWNALVECIIVYGAVELAVRWRDETEIRV